MTNFCMSRSRRCCQRGSNSDNVFYLILVEGMERGSKYHNMRANIGPPANAIEMAFRWRVDNGSPLNTRLVAL